MLRLKIDYLYLTEKAKELIPKVRKEIQGVVNLVTEDLTEEEKFITTNSLKKVLARTQKLKEEVQKEEN